MKVLMPVLHYWPVIGGLENWTQNISERISQESGVFVVTGRVAGQPLRETKNKVSILRTSLFSLKDLSHSSPIYILTAWPFILLKSFSLIKKEKIDIVHCQGFLSSFMGYCLFKMIGVPYVVTVQRMESKSVIKRMVYRRAAICIGASRAVGEYFREIGCQNIEIIPNGVDLKKFENLTRKPHDDFVIITVARLEKVKGINYLIEAVSRLNLNGTRIILDIIGEGSERRSLENLTERLNLRDRVRFLGEIPNEQISEYLAGGDCFVLSSLREGFGIVILEAQAAGLPVVASNVGGIPDLVEDGKTGLLVKPEDPDQLAVAINRVYSGWRPSGISLEKYDWQDIADRVYKVYQKSI
jgi:glycosyltransferase involved in cell wall biosynthesis